MSWWRDGEPFDEHDPEWCKRCTRTDLTKAKCDRCCEEHLKVKKCFACDFFWECDGQCDEAEGIDDEG